jgi:phosphoserine phosphatase
MNNTNSTKSKIKLIVFDLDGVLVDTVSSWVWVHEHYGVNNDTSYEKYMNNEIDDMEFMRSDIALWLAKKAKIHIDEIRRILEQVPLMNGFDATMGILHYLGIEIAIVSSGLLPLAERVASRGNINYVLANGLAIDGDGYLTGEGVLGVSLRAKQEPMVELKTKLGYDDESVIAIGNGETDIPMLKISGFGIAFNPLTEVLASAADAVIKKKDLTETLQYICDINDIPPELSDKCRNVLI